MTQRGPWVAELRAAGNHYPTMSLEEICSLPVADIATDDAILFMWTTPPHLQQSFQVLAAWGFEYKSNAVWVKGQARPGLLRAQSARTASDRHSGRLPMSAASQSTAFGYSSPAPANTRASPLIERMYPELPKIELFARQALGGLGCLG